MDSQLSSELLGRILEEDIFSLSGGESDDEFLGCNLKEDLQKHHPPTRPFPIIDEQIYGPPTPHSKYQPYQSYTNTSISTTLPDVPHSSSIITTTTTYSTINTTIPKEYFTTSHQNTQQSTPATHVPITEGIKKSPIGHILKTQRSCTNIIKPPTSIVPPLCTLPKITPALNSTNQPSTTMPKPKTAPSNHSTLPNTCHSRSTLFLIALIRLQGSIFP